MAPPRFDITACTLLACIFATGAACSGEELNTKSIVEPLQLPDSVASEASGVELAQPLPAVDGLAMEDLEAMALTAHPAIAEAAANVQAARCECLQVGLPPNPTVGYQASEIGNEGQAGQQGFYVGQQFVRGNKLELNRAVAAREVQRLEQVLAAVRLRVLTQVRTTFFEVYLAQRELELTSQLVEVSQQAVDTVQGLVEAQESRRTDLIQAEIEASRTTVLLRQAEAKYQARWRTLAAAIGQPNLASQPLLAHVESLAWPQDWQQSLASLIASSPQIAAAAAEIAKARWQLQRECAEPIPDINAQVGVQYDDSTHDTITGVQVGIALPLWNRNQGAIGRARHKVSAASHKLESVELTLTQLLAEEFQNYQAAQKQAEAFREEILERAEQNLELVREAFQAGEVNYLDLLTVQRTYFQSNLEYLQALRQLNSSVQLLRGLLLGSENQP